MNMAARRPHGATMPQAGAQARGAAAATMCYAPAMTLDQIKQAIMTLSADERARLRAWLADLDTPAAAPTRDDESAASRFGRIAGRAFSDVRKRIREP